MKYGPADADFLIFVLLITGIVIGSFATMMSIAVGAVAIVFLFFFVLDTVGAIMLYALDSYGHFEKKKDILH